MPPRLLLRLSQPKVAPFDIVASISISSTPIASFLVPFLHNHNQVRHASILNTLSDRPGAYNKKIRRGRGPGSGKGGKSGRGSDGQKQHGKVPVEFNGGQTPEKIVHGRYGFKNLHTVEMTPVNLDKIQYWIDQGRLNPSEPITMRHLMSRQCVGKPKDGIKLLGNGASELKTPVHIVVSRASQSAIEAVEALGGTVTTRFYTEQSLRRIRQWETHPYISLRWDPIAIGNPKLLVQGTETLEGRIKVQDYPYRLPDPTSRKDLEYYRDARNRGYLSHTVKEGESANLYFKPVPSPEDLKRLKMESAKAGRAAKRRETDKLW